MSIVGMTVLNQCCHYDTSAKQDVQHITRLVALVEWIKRAGGFSSVIMPPRFFGGENGRIFFTRRPE
ncbi:hypothetical protein Sbal678_4046 [Shewanella baltica OS678]|nr:hypothetical protein Sbal678_4046 [Shewanella baltica OS678]